MIGQQDAEALRPEGPDDRLEVADRKGVDPRERLVKEDEIRVHDHGPGDLQAAPLAARQGQGLGPGQLLQAELLEGRAHAGRPGPRSRHPGLEDGQQVLGHGQLPERGRLLGRRTRPFLALRYIGRSVMSSSLRRTRPPSRGTSPRIIEKVVVLPAPFGPSTR